MDDLLAIDRHDAALALGMFVVVIALGLAEERVPARPTPGFNRRRWIANIAIAVIGVASVQLLIPDPAATSRGAVTWLEIVFGVLALDLLRYAIHRLAHALPVLWRLHAVHHSDPQLDLSTAFRHHPIETLLVGAAMAGAIAWSEMATVSLVIYGSISVLLAPIQHGNCRLPERLESWLQLVLVTPRLHAVHHSLDRQQADANFGILFSFWDRCLSTFRPSEGVPAFGVEGVEPAAAESILGMLAAPLRR
jgi:sterol desaturase/sphingolipid hydroxylase (fatty acid hydroxylase superfamily)